jgi:hypothetical protein
MAIALTTLNLFLLLAALPIQQEQKQQALSLPILRFAQLQPALAQQQYLRLEEAAPQVYRLMPELPLENQYVNREDNKVSENNTLISRLIRYHAYVKGRPFTYRLDWKLTVADYLGANERISRDTYPSADTLKANPYEGDRAVIGRLTRTQRDKLIEALVTTFAPMSTQPSAPPTPTANPPSQPPSQPQLSPSPASPASGSPLRSPQPGDAQLLLP